MYKSQRIHRVEKSIILKNITFRLILYHQFTNKWKIYHGIACLRLSFLDQISWKTMMKLEKLGKITNWSCSRVWEARRKIYKMWIRFNKNAHHFLIWRMIPALCTQIKTFYLEIETLIIWTWYLQINSQWKRISVFTFFSFKNTSLRKL